NHSASSSGRLRVQAADGKFSIEGEGFLWQQTNSSLFISNRVHTTIDPDLLRPQRSNTSAKAFSSEAQGIEIYADQFEYSTEGGLAVYRGHVRVVGTSMN